MIRHAPSTNGLRLAFDPDIVSRFHRGAPNLD